jgi:hypothetical protein
MLSLTGKDDYRLSWGIIMAFARQDKKPMKKFSQGIWSLSSDLNPGPTQYETEVTATSLWHLMIHHSESCFSLYDYTLFQKFVGLLLIIGVHSVMPGHTGTEGGQNSGNTTKLRNRICVGYIERTSVGNTERSSSICLHSVVFMQVH